ncbi:DUF3344 domain-containing protein [Methanosarcina mazei]|uniref:DUF3344 domain-containing protein n=5 Tax=Methanosarcina mazei TaxID=2209 RepID=A0A0F8LJ46_METMZ|nr:DUF3344 domain-containing protein [Methanosarcina mazei]AGF98362.1 Cell surface protein [Methanosarcina mazei Tuc01]AKB40602.1 Cell surface protein [Methanosarcina mazei WWM610]AKB64863.1 Cell surface protein [Methanosarcina mazei S-6]AKB68057.1 Cell surface protein [Methanosarcina mazei LYC]KKG33402.1 hypothetical protein DU49_03645 [Methanosarcina mazei]
MENRNKILITGLLGAGLVLLFSLFSGNGGWYGDGTPPYTIAEGAVRGEVYVSGGHGYTGENPYLEYFELPSGEVRYARLYVPVWNYDSGDSIKVTVNGKELALMKDPDYVSAWGTALYCLNASSSLHTGLNEVSVFSENPGGGPYGITLAAVCENSSLSPVRFWINEGNYALSYTNKKDRVTTAFEDTYPGKNATLYTMLVAGTEGEKDELYFDSASIGSDIGKSAQGKYFDLYSGSVSSENSESILLFERGEEGYIHPCIAVLVSESEANSEFFKLHEQKTGKKANIPLPVIIICLLACIAIALKFRRR